MTSTVHDPRPHLQQAAASLLEQLRAVRNEMVSPSALPAALASRVHPDHRGSAQNLAHYLALRRHDLRPLQGQLAALGLSSLGRAESCSLATINAVINALEHLTSQPHGDWEGVSPADFDEGHRLLTQHTEALLGPAPADREVRIMVTMPTAAATDYTLVHELLARGMNCMRINCAHDDATAWAGMIANLRRAEAALGKSCHVAMDLAGPKLRTGPLEPGPAVLHVRPNRDDFGRVVLPARLWLTHDAPPPEPADAVVPLPAAWLHGLSPGARIHFTDARGARRTLDVTAMRPDGCWAEVTQTCYIAPGTIFRRPGAQQGKSVAARVGAIPARENAIALRAGDTLRITRNLTPGRDAVHDAHGQVLAPAHIGCTIPEVFDRVNAGEPVWFDDGAIGGVIERVEENQVLVRISHTHLGGAKLRADKGINLPESNLALAALTAKDLEDLRFAAQNADIVEMSFANTARDVEQLQQKLHEAGGEPGIVLKIETRRGFENLPEMLLTAMRWPRCGVMIARGDLAVECGFERLAEVQEEVLWICEAAHVPAIWATQVLENLAKEGMPSRAEISDTAMGHRAECVMLNKGPYVLRAVEMLDDILRRMQSHQTKKRALLRHLRLARALHAGV